LASRGRDLVAIANELVGGDSADRRRLNSIRLARRIFGARRARTLAPRPCDSTARDESRFLAFCACPSHEKRAMIRGLFVLLFCQLVGEVVARGLALPVPGPVLGLALLTAGLAAWSHWRPLSDDALAASEVGRVAAGLLGSLSLLFVPAGVGVVQYAGLFGQYGLALALALVVSTFATLLATVGAFLLVKRLLGLEHSEGEA
jgi:putative effector of murein hydrolase LrgA (UPF0299 family)